jgi:two-component system, OmpR family, phosphate regulon sensor histidine kinase PhoR
MRPGRIQGKITLTYVGLILCVVLSLGVLLSMTMESYYHDRLVADLSDRVEMLAVVLAAEPAQTPATLDAWVRKVATVARLRVTLLDSLGAVLIDSDIPLDRIQQVENHLHRPEIQAALRNELGTDVRHSATVDKDFMYVARRIKPADEKGMLTDVAFVRLSRHLEEVQAAVAKIRWIIAILGCGVLLVVATASVFISRRVAQPMVAIAHNVEEIRRGNLDARLDIASNDEIGQVARAVNELVDRLKDDSAQLRKLERVRSEFLGNVSHELRTPIFSLQGFLETLLDGAIDDPSVNRAFLEKAMAHASRLNTLLGDLITISQMESGEMLLSFRYFPLQEMVSGVVAEFQPLAGRQGIRLRHVSQHSAGTEVYGDKERLAVALGNLIENAIKYNTRDGEVVVSDTGGNGEIRIAVRDTGVGIAPEHLSRIFERFYRVDKNRSRDVGGTGLGLAIVKHIVEAHGGTMQVDSEVGKGSTFSFVLKK